MLKRLVGPISACFAVALFANQALGGVAAPPPTVSVMEEFSPTSGVGEYTVTIDSPTGTNWYIPFFAVSSNSSTSTDITNGIGSWNSTIVTPTEWNDGYAFNFLTPMGEETLVNSNFFGSYASIFGNDAVANAYWAGSYLDYQLGFGGFSLIGPDETRGGFEFSASAPTSGFVALAQDTPGGTGGLTITGSATTVPGPASLPLAAIGLFGLAAIARRRRSN